MANEACFMASSRWLTMCARSGMEDHKVQHDLAVCLPFLISDSSGAWSPGWGWGPGEKLRVRGRRRLIVCPSWRPLMGSSQQVSGGEFRGACASLVIVFILNTNGYSGYRGYPGSPIKQMTIMALSPPPFLMIRGRRGHLGPQNLVLIAALLGLLLLLLPRFSHSCWTRFLSHFFINILWDLVSVSAVRCLHPTLFYAHLYVFSGSSGIPNCCRCRLSF